MRESIYLIMVLNFLNRPLLGNWTTNYIWGMARQGCRSSLRRECLKAASAYLVHEIRSDFLIHAQSLGILDGKCLFAKPNTYDLRYSPNQKCTFHPEYTWLFVSAMIKIIYSIYEITWNHYTHWHLPFLLVIIVESLDVY